MRKFIPINEWNIFTPNYVRAVIAKWNADDTNFHDSVEQITIDAFEQRHDSGGSQMAVDQ
jgi:hypothetical protein